MFGFDFFGSSGAPRARGALVSFRLGLLVDGRRRRRRDLRRVQRRGLLLHHGRHVLSSSYPSSSWDDLHLQCHGMTLKKSLFVLFCFLLFPPD